MNLRIREFREDDRAAGVDLWQELTQRHRDIYFDPSIGLEGPGPAFEQYRKKDNLAGVWIAEDGNKVVGMAGLLLQGREAEVEPIVVRADYRSRGIGTALLDRLKAEARALGADFLSIRPVARNVEAIACFHRAGFAVLGHIDMFVDLREGSRVRWNSGISLHGHDFKF